MNDHLESSPIAAPLAPRPISPDTALLLLSIALQLVLGLFLGHLYDMRVNMAAGFLVGTGQNPYPAQDLSAVFHNSYFAHFSTIGYPPPWPLILGAIYRLVHAATSNLLAYNLAIKLPIIAANIGLAYLVHATARRLGASGADARRAWLFMLFNPFILYASAAWGQFDSVVACIGLLAMVMLESGKTLRSAALLGLAIALKPIALPLAPVALVYLWTRSRARAIGFAGLCAIAAALLCVIPFMIFHWNPGVILRNWNTHFVVGGCLSFMSVYELFHKSFQLVGNWRYVGMLWVPALGIATVALIPGIRTLTDLLAKSAALVLVFFLTRTWLSEPNILLLLPFVAILVSINRLDRKFLAAMWILPLVFGIFNLSAPMLLFPSLPEAMDQALRFADKFRFERLAIRSAIVVPWIVVGWWMVGKCYRKGGN